MTGFLAGTGIILATMPASADVKAGVDAWSRGDYRKAVDQWRPDAIKGNADAQFNLAQAYKLGRGVPLDMPMAESWFRKAAMQGHQQAEDNYGLVLFDQGKRKDALPWLEKSAQRGEPRAQLVLGTMLFNGDAVPKKDWPRAYALIVRSVAGGQPKAPQVQAQMDQYIPASDRQKGLELARQYEDDARRPQFTPDRPTRGNPDQPLPGRDVAVGGADVPPSDYGPDSPPPPAPKPTPKPRRTPVPVEVANDPAPPPVQRPAPRPPVTASGGRWQVQLGAFGDAGNARKLWAQVGGRFPGAGVTYAQAGKLTKVLVGPYGSRGAAVAACGAVKPCVPVGN
ncbi:SPOR domain-containing protein [Sphingomonas immobilis]|uniref:SPOR domain-containing protein n=1 Tax=Sphingomonas immobilis TaxID=3063997 RepID=A0ABT8ZUG9_9SPHN|nr:SPOR domain-containing protein [Sphingomonas sp. CA1-15]MDO7841226.1 SPOR domain-containing protein [Sphingomonas sp. CA1-15]